MEKKKVGTKSKPRCPCLTCKYFKDENGEANVTTSTGRVFQGLIGCYCKFHNNWYLGVKNAQPDIHQCDDYKEPEIGKIIVDYSESIEKMNEEIKRIYEKIESKNKEVIKSDPLEVIKIENMTGDVHYNKKSWKQKTANQNLNK